MSRSSKKKKKKKMQLIVGIVTTFLVVAGVCYLFATGEDESIPLLHTEDLLHINPDTSGDSNQSQGDVHKDDIHDIPYYLQEYFGDNPESPLLTGEDPYEKYEESLKDKEKQDKDKEEEEKKKEDKDKDKGKDKKEDKGSDVKPTEPPKKEPKETPKPTEKPTPPPKEDVEEGYLEVHFIDVGQGDSILIKFVDTNKDNGDDSASMLVDAGDGNSGTAVRNYISKQGVKELDYFVCTHPDSDHIGGAASVVSNVKINSEVVWGPTFEKNTKTYNNLMNEISYKYYKYEPPVIGSTYNLGLAQFVFLGPEKEYEDCNDNSLVFNIWYGDDSFLLVGDCEIEEEADLISSSYIKYLDADVLKVGHHGSKTASSTAFLDLVTPEVAVISCGEGNSYHHPHAGALNNLRASEASLYRTDLQGSIIATTYGSGITWNASPCNDWTSGE